jgi:hypothetical protein
MLETGRFCIPGLLEEVLDADPDVGVELATLGVVPDPEVVVGLEDPPDEHDAMTSAAPPIRVTATFRRAVETRERLPRWSLSTSSFLLAGLTLRQEPGARSRSKTNVKFTGVSPCGGAVKMAKSPVSCQTLPMRDPGGMSESGTTLSPRLSDPQLDGDHERMAHIVLEGFTPEEGDYVSAGPSVVEGMVNGTAVRALCGKIWVPGRDPKRYGICPTCKEIAEARGWKVPAG